MSSNWGTSSCSMRQGTLARYVAKKKEHSHHVECAMREYVSLVELQKMACVSIAKRQDAKYAASSWPLVRVTPAGN
jgi:hypothetical protein